MWLQRDVWGPVWRTQERSAVWSSPRRLLVSSRGTNCHLQLLQIPNFKLHIEKQQDSTVNFNAPTRRRRGLSKVYLTKEDSNLTILISVELTHINLSGSTSIRWNRQVALYMLYGKRSEDLVYVQWGAWQECIRGAGARFISKQHDDAPEWVRGTKCCSPGATVRFFTGRWRFGEAPSDVLLSVEVEKLLV